MTEPETRQPVPEIDRSNSNANGTATDTESTVVPEAEVPPEPWTPERVFQWNAYYDVYVMWATLLLAFLVSCNYVTDSQFWLQLKSGELIADRAGPVMTDTFSYTEDGRRWVDLAWMFQWIHAAVYKLVYGLVPVSQTDPTANRAGAEQIAVGTLVALSAILRLVTAWMLLKIRRPGPGLWWSAVCVTLAVGVVFHPLLGIVTGGIALPATVAPATWAQLLLSFELLVLFRAFFLNRPRALWWLIPAFVLWANLDESFLTGLLVLAAAVFGRWLDGVLGTGTSAIDRAPINAKPSDAFDDADLPRPVRAGTACVILGACALACLANPFTYRAYGAAVAPYLQYFRPAGTITTVDQLSIFGTELRKQLGPEWKWLALYFGCLVGLGIGSFLLNLRRFSWARFLPFAVVSVVWALLMHSNATFALVLAAVVAPNGQEWYHDRFGTAGRLGGGWTFWSTGGRLVTLMLLFAVMSKDITGWGNTLPEVQFGLGFHPDDFTLEAADFLNRHNEIKGNIFNTSLHQGDVLIWKAAPKRKTYIDGRARLFPHERLEEWHAIRNALKDDDVAKWKPLLDLYGVYAVMIEPGGVGGAPNTYRRLMRSPNWVPFYDDGRIVMFGRADAPGTDLAFFKGNKLDPELRAYRINHPVANFERPPTPTTWIDTVFQNRTFARPQSRTESARRWLEGADVDGPATSSQGPAIPEPARCLLAIQESRTALAQSPDDWIAFRRLKDAYRFLMMQEAAMLAGIPITPENRSRIMSVQPELTHLMSRFQQRVTSLNYAIMTTPPPKSAAARQDLAALNLELFQLFFMASARDLAAERLKAVIDQSQPEDFSADMEAQLKQQLSVLEDESKKLEDQLEDLEVVRSATPIDQANYALSNGGTGWAIAQLVEALASNMSPADVKPRLIDLYCNTGQPDKAQELLTEGSIDDPNLGREPGSGALRQGRVYFLLGNYLSASTLWEDRAIPRVRFDRANRVMFGGRDLVRGDAIPATNAVLSVPSSLQQQATWSYELAMCQLEGGMPEEAAKQFTQALTLAPDLAIRPIAAYYLQKMGKPVPPPLKREGKATRTGQASSVSRPNLGLPLPQPAAPQTVPPGAAPASEPATVPPAAKQGKEKG
jgi:tetratricopeptide (TPR) repeat protein